MRLLEKFTISVLLKKYPLSYLFTLPLDGHFIPVDNKMLLLLHIHNITDPGLMEEGCGITGVEVEGCGVTGVEVEGCCVTGVSCGGTKGGGDGDFDFCLPEIALQEDNSKFYMQESKQQICHVHHT